MAFARAVAVLETDVEVAHARRLANLDSDTAAQVFDALVAAEVLSPGRPLRFSDPVLRDAVYGSMEDGERARAHARAAHVLAASGTDPERVAAHLLHVDPDGDADTVAALRLAAKVARARRAPEDSATYLRRALAEPPEPHVRPAVLLELSDADIAAGSARLRRLEPDGASSDVPTSRALQSAAWSGGQVVSRGDEDATLLAATAIEAAREGNRTCAEARDAALRALTRDWRQIAAATALYRCDAFELADSALERIIEDDAEPLAVMAIGERGLSRARQGRLLEACEDLGAAAPRSQEHAAEMVVCQLELDQVEAAQATLAAAEVDDPDPDADVGDALARCAWLLARARVCAAVGDSERALEELLRCGALAERHGALNPAYLAWRSEAADVALRLGRDDLAQRVAHEELELARLFGAPRALGIALRAAGLGTPAPENRELLEMSVDALRASGASLELARSLVALGAALRRAGERSSARTPLREALALAERLEARRVVASAVEELRATGAKRSARTQAGPGALTPSERRVAELAARGRTNREIAQELFVTVRTVTTHLTHIYRKLDIASRDELAATLESEPEAGPRGEPSAVSQAPSEPRTPAATKRARRATRAATPLGPRSPAPPDAQKPIPVDEPVETARHALASGGTTPVVDYCTDVLRTAKDLARRAQTAELLAEALFYAGRLGEAHTAATTALQELREGATPALAAPLEAVRACVELVDRRFAADLERRIGTLKMLAVAAGGAGRALTLVEAAWRRPRQLAGDSPSALVERGLDAGGFLEEQTADNPATLFALATLVYTDDSRRARRLIGDVLMDAARRGSGLAGSLGLAYAAQLALREGDVAAAEADARSALALCRPGSVGLLELLAACLSAEASLERGRLDAAVAEIESRPLMEELSESSIAAYALYVRGAVRAAQGRHEDAIRDLRDSGELSSGLLPDDVNVYPWRSTLALLYPRERREEALALVQDELALARRFRQPRAIGVALRARGLLDDGEGRIATLREAVDRLASSSARVEQARALRDLGRALVQGGEPAAAQEPLREAVALATRGGATALAVQALRDLGELRSG